MAKITSGQLYAARNKVNNSLRLITEAETYLNSAKTIITYDQTGKIVSTINNNLTDKISKLQLASSYLVSAAKALEKYASILSNQERLEAAEASKNARISEASKRIDQRAGSTYISET